MADDAIGYVRPAEMPLGVEVVSMRANAAWHNFGLVFVLLIFT